MLRFLWTLRRDLRPSVHRLRTCNRSLSSDDSSQPSPSPSPPKKRSLPPLMDFPELVWPTVFKSMKNWIMVNFIIRPYFDRDFSMPDFVQGAKHALHVVSGKLSEGDTVGLSDWVAQECVGELNNSLRGMSVAQRHEIRVIKEDVYFSFPYQVGVIFDEGSSDAQKRWVEITMIFHALRGLRDMQERGESPPINLGVMPEYRGRISICNYRFIKEFTKGSESDWTVNIVNHFKPSDMLEE
ncbi:m-AAA protease-interacting protein 1, mitochondrial [Phlebotomus argentipes]|uniref:m-AAA protease-interacting protein 1, mitochondrial n=1 Tax=Phlebotomus argentipes TaxID=94469 RepID=UPI00289368FB|nr:m-AAA protease-interacting protein 1, mitochondrial [Phlebotomus argentipes]